MRIQSITVGQMQTNCYMVHDEETMEGILVDPGAQSKLLLERIAREGINLKAILLTHGHFDHIMGAIEVRKQTGAPIYASEKAKELLQDPDKNLSAMYSLPITLEADYYLNDLDEVTFCGYPFRMLATPGHTVGSVCYYVEDEDVLFSGDTLFFESLGRTDLATSNTRDILSSIINRLFILPGETMVYPGHGELTDIAHEKECNPVAAYINDYKM